MKIKRLQPDDKTLAEKAIRILKTDGNPPATNIHSYAYVGNFLNNHKNYFIVATENGNPIGFVLAYEIDRLDRPEPMILFYEVSVLENARRQGVAKAMIGLLKTICRERNIMKMWVLTNEANRAAMRTFVSTGGRRGEEDDMIMFSYLPEDFIANRI